MALNDSQYDFLKSLGYDGALNDMWQDYLLDFAGTLVDSSELNDLWQALYRSLGYDLSLSEAQWLYMTDQGYSDPYEFWQDILAGTATAPGLSSLIAYYPLTLHTNNVSGAGSLTVLRNSDKNIPPNTYPDNVAAIKQGVGVLLEGEATNLVTYSEDLSNANWIPTNGVTLGSQVDIESHALWELYLPDGDYGTRHQGNTVSPVSSTSGEKYTLSVWIDSKGNESETIALKIATNAVNYFQETVLLDGLHRYSFTAELTASGSSLMYYAIASGLAQTKDIDIAIGEFQLEAASSPSSYIKTTGATATRFADTATVATSEVWVDEGCYISDCNRTDTVPFTNGIYRQHDSTFQIQMNPVAGNGTGISAGKYNGLSSADMVGAVFANDPRYRVLVVGGQQWSVSHPNNTLEELIDMFGNDGVNPKLFTIDFSPSVYGDNNDYAGMKALRELVGDYGKKTGTVTTSPAVTATENGNVYTLNGAYSLDDILVYLDFPSQGDVRANYVVADITVTGTAPPTGIEALGSQLVLGNQIVTAELPTSLPTPLQTGLIYENGTGGGSIDCVVTINAVYIATWNDWLTDNFRLSFEAVLPQSSIEYDQFTSYWSSTESVTEAGSLVLQSNPSGDSVRLLLANVNIATVQRSNLIADDVNTFVVEKNANNYKLIVNGVEDTGTNLNDVVWGARLYLASRIQVGWVTDRQLNGYYRNLRIEPL